MAEWSLQDAKNKFSTLVDAALAGEPLRVNPRGPPAVVELSEEECELLRRIARAEAPTFNKLLLMIPQDDQEFDHLSLPERPFDF